MRSRAAQFLCGLMIVNLTDHIIIIYVNRIRILSMHCLEIEISSLYTNVKSSLFIYQREQRNKPYLNFCLFGCLSVYLACVFLFAFQEKTNPLFPMTLFLYILYCTYEMVMLMADFNCPTPFGNKMAASKSALEQLQTFFLLFTRTRVHRLQRNVFCCSIDA